MTESGLTDEAQERVASLFPAQSRKQVCEILMKECGNNLPFCEELDARALDRLRFAVLKLSEGDLAKLWSAVELAKRDWRDLLVAAGFADDVQAHRHWKPGVQA
jgi:hypothetical protein